MPVNVTHLLAADAPEDAVRLLSLLLRTAAPTGPAHRVIVLGRRPAALKLPGAGGVAHLPVRPGVPMLSLRPLRRMLAQAPPDVVHALDARSAAAAFVLRRFGEKARVIVTLTDPGEARVVSRWWQTLETEHRTGEFLCASSIIQRRLVEAGIAREATAVVRPGVDFAEIKAARENPPISLICGSSLSTHDSSIPRVRPESVGVGPASSRSTRTGKMPAPQGVSGRTLSTRHSAFSIQHSAPSAEGGQTAATGGGRSGEGRGPVLVMPSPPSRAGGQFLGVWAVAILHQIWPNVRLLIPGCSREADRIGRLLGRIYCPQAFVMTGDQYSPAELLSAADALIVPAVEDIPTGWLAWAMAAGVPIIGSAIHAVTECIADRHNGFLCKPGEPHTLAIRIRTAFESPDQMRQCVEVARGQAYDVFRAQQCVEHYSNAFTTLAAGRPAVSAVRDAALAT